MANNKIKQEVLNKKELKFDPKKIHYFKLGSEKILLDVNSGSVHLIDDMAWQALDILLETQDWSKTRANFPEGKEVINELESLTEENMLFSDDPHEDNYQPPASQLKSLCFNICHDCDMRCRYCFAGTGNFGGARQVMPWSTAKAAMDYLFANSPRKFCEIDFFGGEPLLNLDVVKKTVDYGRKLAEQHGKTLKFTITTNGVGLNKEVQKYLNNADISVVLSHDGRPEVHDKMRMMADGSPSHDIINANIKEFLKDRSQGDYYIRGTYTGWNKDFVEDIKHWLDQGYTLLSMEPVVEKKAPWALSERDLPALKNEYIKLARLYESKRKAGEEFEFFHFNIDLNQGPCLPKLLTGCGAGYEYMVVDPNGDLYPCHQFVGRENYKIGDINQGVTEPSIIENFRQAYIYNKEACRNCWARFHCSGGCHANAQAWHDDIYKPYELGCELEKIRLECAIWLAVRNLMER